MTIDFSAIAKSKPVVNLFNFSNDLPKVDGGFNCVVNMSPYAFNHFKDLLTKSLTDYVDTVAQGSRTRLVFEDLSRDLVPFGKLTMRQRDVLLYRGYIPVYANTGNASVGVHTRKAVIYDYAKRFVCAALFGRDRLLYEPIKPQTAYLFLQTIHEFIQPEPEVRIENISEGLSTLRMSIPTLGKDTVEFFYDPYRNEFKFPQEFSDVFDVYPALHRALQFSETGKTFQGEYHG